MRTDRPGREPGFDLAPDHGRHLGGIGGRNPGDRGPGVDLGHRLHQGAGGIRSIGPGGNQASIWHRIMADTSVALAAETLGTADRALTLAIDYTKERVVFDQPVASFQVVKHKIVDMFHQIEMARVAVQFAAWASDAEAPERQRAAAMAAAYTSEAAVKVTGEAIQLHGGVGFTWACDAHFLFKRAKQNDVLIGGHAGQRKRLATMLIDTA